MLGGMHAARRLLTVATLVAVAVAVVAWPARSASAAPRMLKGPYLQDLAPTSITVMWELDEPTAAHLVVDGPGGERAQDVPSAHVAEATISGLVPATRYRYRVEAGGQTWRPASSRPLRRSAHRRCRSRSWCSATVGPGTEAHRRVVERACRKKVPDFVVGTGDMVDDGAREDQWQQFFEVERQVMRDNVFFPAVGNHDRQGRGRTIDTYRRLLLGARQRR